MPDEQTTNPTTDESTANAQPVVSTQPQTTDVAPVPSSAPVTTKKRKLKLPVLLALIAGGVVLLGGSASAYFGVILPKKPDNIIKKGLVNTFGGATTEFEGQVNVTGPEVPKAFSGVSFSGESNESGAFSMTSSANFTVTKITLDLKSQDSKTIYARLGGVKNASNIAKGFGVDQSDPTLGFVLPILSALNDQWLLLSQEDQNLLQQTAAKGQSYQLNPAQRAQIGTIYKKHPFLKVQKRLVDETVRGDQSYHYSMKLDKAAAKAFLADLKNAGISGITITQNDLNKTNQQIDKFDASKNSVELWVSKAKIKLNQVAVSHTENGSTVKLRVSFESSTKTLNIEKPADAKPLGDVLGNLFSGQ